MQTLPLRFQNWMAGNMRPHPDAGEPPLRAELFSVEQLARHAKALAANHQVVTRQGSNRLLARLGENEAILRAFNHATLDRRADSPRPAAPAPGLQPGIAASLERAFRRTAAHL